MMGMGKTEDRMARAPLALLPLLLAAVAGGCGGGFRTGVDWDPKEGRLFDDGIDVMEDLSRLSGKWELDARDELDARANLADAIAIVEVLSVQTNADLDGVESKKLDARVEEILYGRMPTSELSLVSSPDSLGYALVIRHEARLVGRHIAFLRWFDGPDGKPANHFHLSPLAERLEGSLRKLLKARKDEEEAQKAARPQ